MGEIDNISVKAGGFTFTGFSKGPSDGRPVLLLHGFPQTSWSWHRQLDALGDAGFRAVALDQRGYSPGARPEDTASYHIDFLVSDVLELADALGMDKFDLVGHDWGGMVAWVTGARHPERLRTLTVLSTPHPTAFGSAIASSEGDQKQRSSYISVFRQEGVAERALLGEDGSGDGLRTLFAASGLATDDVPVFVEAMSQPGALTAALNWYRATEVDSMHDVGQVAVPTM
jgi:pimeloyl-ACP methyl ester carboxylesterase